MELWRASRWVRFVKRQIKLGEKYAAVEYCRATFLAEKHRWFFKRFSDEQVRAMEEFCLAREYLTKYIGRKFADPCYRLTVDGRQFAEGWIIGFLVEATKRYSPLILLLSGLGIGALINRIVSLF